MTTFIHFSEEERQSLAMAAYDILKEPDEPYATSLFIINNVRRYLNIPIKADTKPRRNEMDRQKKYLQNLEDLSSSVEDYHLLIEAFNALRFYGTWEDERYIKVLPLMKDCMDTFFKLMMVDITCVFNSATAYYVSKTFQCGIQSTYDTYHFIRDNSELEMWKFINKYGERIMSDETKQKIEMILDEIR